MNAKKNIMQNYSKIKTENKKIKKQCWICFENDKKIYISPCKCKGTLNWVHQKCLNKWINMSQKNTCPNCKFKFIKNRV